MRFSFTDEHRALRESVRGVVGRCLPPERVRAAIDAGDRSALRRLSAQQGWGGVGTPEELGGQGGGAVELAILHEELARSAVPGSTLLTSAICRRMLAAAKPDQAAVELIAGLAHDRLTAAVAWRADTSGAGHVRVVDGVAEGSVPHVLGAPEADVLLLATEHGCDVVTLTDPGVLVMPHELLDLGRTVADVAFSAARVEHLADTADLREGHDVAAILIAAEALGAARGLLLMTVDHIGRREQFGVAVGSFQAVKHAAADMLVEVETAHSAVYYAAWALDADDPARGVAVSVAKSFAARAATQVADTALALHGAVGFTWEHDLHLLLRRARTSSVLYGTPGMHEEQLASLLRLGANAPSAEEERVHGLR